MNAPQSAETLAELFELSADDRYDYFIAESVRQGRVWTLKGEGGFVAFCDEEGRDCFPFWPAPGLAEALANDDWADCRAEPLDLQVFMSRWLEGMSRDGRLVSVFSAPDGTAIVADPLELLNDLAGALSGDTPG
jgi:hypothetical protein